MRRNMDGRSFTPFYTARFVVGRFVSIRVSRIQRATPPLFTIHLLSVLFPIIAIFFVRFHIAHKNTEYMYRGV